MARPMPREPPVTRATRPARPAGWRAIGSGRRSRRTGEYPLVGGRSAQAASITTAKTVPPLPTLITSARRPATGWASERAPAASRGGGCQTDRGRRDTALREQQRGRDPGATGRAGLAERALDCDHRDRAIAEDDTQGLRLRGVEHRAAVGRGIDDVDRIGRQAGPRERVAHHPDERVRADGQALNRSVIRGRRAGYVTEDARAAARAGASSSSTNRNAPSPIRKPRRAGRTAAGLVIRRHHSRTSRGRGRRPARGRRRRRRARRDMAAADEPCREVDRRQAGRFLVVSVALGPRSPSSSAQTEAGALPTVLLKRRAGEVRRPAQVVLEIFGGGVDAGRERAERDAEIVVALGAAWEPACSIASRRGADRDARDCVDAPELERHDQPRGIDPAMRARAASATGRARTR